MMTQSSIAKGGKSYAIQTEYYELAPSGVWCFKQLPVFAGDC